MTADRDRIETARDERAAEHAPLDAQVADRIAERDIQRDVQREADRRPANVQQVDGERAALFESAVLSEFNTRWTDIQAGFVDEPRRAVQQADALVSDVINRIANTFTNERAQLEQQWDRGGDVSTEELRQALQRYRSFFSRLLTL